MSTEIDHKRSIDYLKMYFCEPYHLTNDITIYQPTIQDIIDAGENNFYSMIYVFIGNTTFFRLSLWKNGIDWNKITDFEMFGSMVTMLSPDDTKTLFGNLDFRDFKLFKININLIPEDQRELYRKKYIVPKPSKTKDSNSDIEKGKNKQEENEEIAYVLYNEKLNTEITEYDYNNMAFYIRSMFGIFPKTEYAKGKAAKEMIIEEEEEKVRLAQKEDKPTSILFPLISSCLNHPGFKYKKNELKEVGIFEFMDSANRLQVYESTTALLKGMYSGFVNVKDINKKEFNFMRDIHE